MSPDEVLGHLRQAADELEEGAKEAVKKARRQRSTLPSNAYRYAAIDARRSADWYRALADALEARPSTLESIASELPILGGC